MPQILSIKWNVEDFRRLISEPSQLSEEKLPTVDFASLEIAPSPEKREEAVLPEEAATPAAEVSPPKINNVLDPKLFDEAVVAEPKEILAVEVINVECEIAHLEGADIGRPADNSSDEIANSILVPGPPTASDLRETIPPNKLLEEGAPEASDKASEILDLLVDAAASPLVAASGEVTPKLWSLQQGGEGADISASRPTQEATSSPYRGVEFTTVKCALGGRWRWSVLVGQPAMLRMGEAATEQQAELDARNVIDRAIAIQETLRRLKRRDHSDT
jgi:hypothetical protein